MGRGFAPVDPSKPTNQSGSESPANKKILDENIEKLKGLGLPHATYLLLSSDGLNTVGQLIERLNSTKPKIKGVGKVNGQAIYNALLLARLQRGSGGKWS
jgi:DNA-directed RNA polymerase alpha subunit